MVSAHNVTEWLESAARSFPARIAVQDSAGRSIRYDSFVVVAGDVARALGAAGVSPGVRVVVLMRKSIDLLIAFYAILRCGAAYVPADPAGPLARAALIAKDAEAAAVIVDNDVADAMAAALMDVHYDVTILRLPAQPLAGMTWRIEAMLSTPPVGPTHAAGPIDVAFLLYTSGSTGVPKAVAITHRNVITFIDWCSTWVTPTEHDRFAAHAPLHFSLSVFHVYLAWKHGARLVLFDEEAGKVPALAAQQMARDGITVWFSTPTILSWMAQSGLLPSLDLRALRLVMFSGESFPVASLQQLRTQLPAPEYVHTLGSTETHMIAQYRIPRDVTLPARLPVGHVAGHFGYRVVDEQLQDVPRGVQGELWVTGPGVTPGYWRRPNESAAAFVADAAGFRWYRTRDLVVVQPDGTLVHCGRRDRVIKKRGNRIELADVEACLYRHAQIREAAVVAHDDPTRGVMLKAFVVPRSAARPSIIQLKAHCSRTLPLYMVPDTFQFADALPRTSNGKIDFPSLQALA